MDGTLDYKSYFEQFRLSLSGLVPNVRGGEPDVNHSWRFIAREEPCLPISPPVLNHNFKWFVHSLYSLVQTLSYLFLYLNTPRPLPVELDCYPTEWK